MLRSIDFAKQLIFLYGSLPIETKNRNYVSKWLVTLLTDEESTTVSPDEFPSITKKIRDEILGMTIVIMLTFKTVYNISSFESFDFIIFNFFNHSN